MINGTNNEDSDEKHQPDQDDVIQPHRPQSQNIIECPECGTKNQLNPGDDPNVLKCGKCTSDLVRRPVVVDPVIDSSVITDEDFTAFIGKNTDKYLKKFKKFNINGKDSCPHR